jgi:uncharacterized protein
MSDTFDESEWREELEAEREGTTHYFLTHFNWRGTPIPDDFSGPKYYPLDPKWRVSAHLDRDAPGTGTRVELATSIGDLREFDIYGTFHFTAEGLECALTAYRLVPENPEQDYLFVPFKDATSGHETYGAGRYLDIPRLDGTDYTLDFNLAYNPLCAYSPRYNCPYPPPHNRLSVRVEAGEKVPFEH